MNHLHPSRLQKRPWLIVGKICVGILLLAVATGCNSTSKLQRALNKNAMEYEKHPTNYNLTALAHSYGEILDAQTGDTVQPGFFAAYGVALARLGKNSEANRMFNNEVMLYPNAARYVRQLKLQLVPEYIADTVADTSTIYIIEMDTEYQAESNPRNKSTMGSDDTDGESVKALHSKVKNLQKQDRAAEKKAKEKAKKAAAKQKAKEKKRAAKEKEALRKEQQRQRARERAAARQRDNDED